MGWKVSKKARLLALFVAVFLLAGSVNSSFSATTSSGKNPTDPFSKPHSIFVVGLTPDDSPNYWSASDSDPTSKLQKAVSDAMGYWQRISKNRFNYTVTYLFAPAGTAISHCDTIGDWQKSQIIAKISTLNPFQHLLVINPKNTCPYSGYADVSGSRIIIKYLTSSNVAHEFGHNLGFLHSATVSCPGDNFAAINNNCTINSYGDDTDIMGSAVVFDGSKLSLAQQLLRFGIPKPQVALSGTFILGENAKKGTIPLLSIATKNGTALLEFDDATQNGGLAISPSDSPGVEIRITGSALSKQFKGDSESGIGTLALLRLAGVDANGKCTSTCHIELRFHPGETVQIPNSPLRIAVGSVSGKSISVTIVTPALIAKRVNLQAPVIKNLPAEVLNSGSELTWQSSAANKDVAGYLVYAVVPADIYGINEVHKIIISRLAPDAQSFILPNPPTGLNSWVSVAVVAFDKFGNKSPMNFVNFNG